MKKTSESDDYMKWMGGSYTQISPTCFVKDIMFCGYEVPENICRLTKTVLRRLKRDGIVVVNYDDNYGRIAAEEIEHIAGSIGLTFAHVHGQQFIIADEDGGKIKAMELESLDSDFPE